MAEPQTSVPTRGVGASLVIACLGVGLLLGIGNAFLNSVGVDSVVVKNILGWGLGVPVFLAVFFLACEVPLEDIKCAKCGTRYKSKNGVKYSTCRKCGNTH